MQKKASFLVSLLDVLRARLPNDEHSLAATFSRQFWSRVPEEDLAEWAAADAASVTIAALKRFRERASDAVDVEALNPDPQRDGWSSKHTVVFIGHRDMPFITDSVLMELSHHGLVTHHLQNVVFHCIRDASNRLDRIDRDAPDARAEVLIYAEIDQLEDERLAPLSNRLQAILADVRAVVGDFEAMKGKLTDLIEGLRDSPPPLAADEVEEGIAFLEWLLRNRLTFLGYREFDYSNGMIRQVDDSALGILRNRDPATERSLRDQPEETRSFILEPRLLAFSKSGTRSQVHRPAYPDYIAVKRFDANGNVVGEHGFLGLYTSPVYSERPDAIPVLRRKVENIRERSGLDRGGFDGKVLAHVLATFPRDELFQSSEDELFNTVMGITHIHERRKTRVFLRRDRYGLFYTCLVYMPREVFNTQLRVRIQRLLMETLGAHDAPFDAYFSESILVRLQFTVRVPARARTAAVDVDDLQRRIVALTRDWAQDLRDALAQEHGEADARRLADRYVDAFPAGYRESWDVAAAVADIADMESLVDEARINMRLHRNPEDADNVVHLKVFHKRAPLPLSDILPVLENMGVRVIAENPFIVSAADVEVSIHDYRLELREALDLAEVGDRFERAFIHTWDGANDNDTFNRLVLSAALDWREVTVLRAYARYMRQIRYGFSQEFIADTLSAHPAIAAKLVQYFLARFEPKGTADDGRSIRHQILSLLEGVALLNEDRILRRFVELMDATLRTNYFQRGTDGLPKPQFCFKLAGNLISAMPAPVPKFEIFVFSPRVEGVHLRGGPIARGGLRWSDRREDFRTEVLGLVKAQVVKNAVIVPTGAKGGFVVRRPPAERDAFQAEGVACYRQFISGLLDVSDNIVAGSVVPPPDVRRYDGDDPYLVVAADKGTATFSDIANEMSRKYGFWMDDAFASGGSNGYDHKKMGITAKGAWISVQRHFAEKGVDVQTDPITIVGIGDMSGDVFGNGLLLSKSALLVAAFNHLHVFIDPNPDAARSFVERARLFALPRSSWADYDNSILSAGGGVYSRSQKSIALSAEARARFDIDKEQLSPDELIHELLKAPVDLIWNGGIGTYVKGSGETHADVGDKANDHIRVDAHQLRCKAFGEGGNLGMSQQARVEYALCGGAVNTDFIDNAGGVDCSDHEVNLKILLNGRVADGEMTVEQRNELLLSMTDDVAELVLTNNFRQAQALSLAERQVRFRLSEYQRFISRMESDARLDRKLEGVPADEELTERAAAGKSLTRPELAILLSYAKTHLKERLIAGQVHRDAVVAKALFEEFPAVIRERHSDAAYKHRLFPEIVATMVANDIVHHLGITSVVHLSEFVGGEIDEIARAYYAAAACFDIRAHFRAVEALSGVGGEAKLEMLLELMQLARRATRWFMRHRRVDLDVARLTAHFTPRIASLNGHIDGIMGAAGSRRRATRMAQRMELGVPENVAAVTSNAAALAVTLPVIDSAERAGASPEAVADVFAAMNETLGFDWLAEQTMALNASSLWQSMERDALVDELVTQHSMLAAMALRTANGATGAEAVARWSETQAHLVGTWRQALESAQRASSQDFSLYSMTLRKLGDLTRALSNAA